MEGNEDPPLEDTGTPIEVYENIIRSLEVADRTINEGEDVIRVHNERLAQLSPEEHQRREELKKSMETVKNALERARGLKEQLLGHLVTMRKALNDIKDLERDLGVN